MSTSSINSSKVMTYITYKLKANKPSPTWAFNSGQL